MRKRFKGVLYFLLLIIIILLVVGAFYFVYVKFLYTGEDIKKIGPLSVNYKNGSFLRIKGKKEISFSIINDSNEDAYYYIEFRNPKNIKGKVSYTLTNNEDINITDELNSYNTIISSYNLIGGGEIDNFKINFDSSDDFTYTLELFINTENLETNTFAEVILNNNEIKESPLTIPGQEIATTEEGLIKSSDDFGTTYYFRGISNNNFVSINNLPFRIVRINGDGTVKLIYDGMLPDLKKYYETYDKYEYNQTIVNTYLKAWVHSNLGDYENYLANNKFCNDINLEENTFLALSRLKQDNIPSFVCLGDKVLNKIGLLTADEVIYAGGSLTEANESYYLNNDLVTSSYYTMTSAQMHDSAYYPFMVSTTGKVIMDTSGGNLGAVRPVINIIKTATVTGNGTVNDPYVLTNE